MTDKDVAVMHLERQTGQGISADDAEFLSNFSDEAKKKVLRKVGAIIIGTKKLLTKCCRSTYVFIRSRFIDPENDD